MTQSTSPSTQRTPRSQRAQRTTVWVEQRVFSAISALSALSAFCSEVLFFSTTLTALTALTAEAQVVPDAHTIPRGALRVSLSPHYLSWDHVFDENGEVVLLGRFLDTDSAGTNLFPALEPAEAAIVAITGDSAYRMTAGALRLNLDADRRIIPLRLQLGLTNRITLTAALPIVNTNMNVAMRIDTADANVGLNDLSAGAAALLGELEAAAAAVAGVVASECPTGPNCAEAQRLEAEVATVRNMVVVLFGGGSAARPPFAPLATSNEADAIVAAIDALSADLQALGVAGLTDTSLPFPGAAVDSTALQTVLTDPAYGYGARPLATTKLTRRLGDVEVGMRLGLVQTRAVRSVLSSTVRLPTGTRDRPDDFLDVAAGDRQLDLEVGFELALEPGSVVALWLGGWYNLQFSDRLERRVTPPEQPLAFVSTRTTVERNLGDELRVSAYPAIRLTDRIRVFVTAEYYRKAADRFPGNEILETFTEMERVSYGGGIWYRADREPQGKLPVEAGLIYRAAFSGSGGFTAKTSGVEFSLRLFYRLWGSGAAEQ